MRAPPWDLEVLSPDIAVLVVLAEEFAELARSLSTAWFARKNPKFGGYDYFWIDPASGYRCVATFGGRMSPEEAVQLANRLLEHDPATIVNIGIAASLHEDVKIGDVVVPDLVVAYDKTSKIRPTATPDEGREVPDDWAIDRRSDGFRATHTLVEEVKHLAHAHRDAYERWREGGRAGFEVIQTRNRAAIGALLAQRNAVLSAEPAVLVETLASGHAVVAAESFARWVRAGNGDIKALEMEAAGMLLAAEKRAEGLAKLVIRGISDHSAVDKARTEAIESGALRRLAMRNALGVFELLMETGAFVRAVRAKRSLWPWMLGVGGVALMAGTFAFELPASEQEPTAESVPAEAPKHPICRPGDACESGLCSADTCVDLTEKSMVPISGGLLEGTTIADFWLDATEVTVEAYQKCVEAKRCKPRSSRVVGGAPRDDVHGECNWGKKDRAKHPMNCVNWSDATAYCAWRASTLPDLPGWTLMLPAESHWIWAAASGRSPLSRYPFDGEPSGALVNACGPECVAHRRATGDKLAPTLVPMYADDDGWSTTAPVNSKPAGTTAAGIADLAGNVGSGRIRAGPSKAIELSEAEVGATRRASTLVSRRVVARFTQTSRIHSQAFAALWSVEWTCSNFLTSGGLATEG